MRSILLLLALCVPAFAQTFSGMTIRSMSISTNLPSSGGGGGGATYLLAENFEGTGYENAGWTPTGTVDPDNTTNVLAGSQSLTVVGPGSSTIYESFTAKDEVWFYCMFKAMVNRDWWAVHIKDASDKSLCVFQLSADGTVTVQDDAFHNDSCVTKMTAGTVYHVWMRYKKGTGANGEGQIWFNTSATFPGAGDNDALAVNFNGTTQATKLMLTTDTPGTGSFIFDKVRVDDVAITSNPD